MSRLNIMCFSEIYDPGNASHSGTTNNLSQSNTNKRMLPPLHLPSFSQTGNAKSTSVSASILPPNLKRLSGTTTSSMLSQFKSPALPSPVVPTQMILEFNDEDDYQSQQHQAADQSSSQVQSRSGTSQMSVGIIHKC